MPSTRAHAQYKESRMVQCTIEVLRLKKLLSFNRGPEVCDPDNAAGLRSQQKTEYYPQIFAKMYAISDQISQD